MSFVDQPDPADWLPSRTTFIQERTEREHTEGVTWSFGLSSRIQPRLLRVYEASYPSRPGPWEEEVNSRLSEYVHQHSETQITSYSIHAALSSEGWTSASPIEQWDWIAAVPIVLERFRDKYEGEMSDDDEYAYKLSFKPDEFVARANDLLLDDRVKFTFINSRLRPLNDEPLHTSLVQPTEALLSNDPRFAKAETAYLEATRNLASAHYGEATPGSGGLSEG